MQVSLQFVPCLMLVTGTTEGPGPRGAEDFGSSAPPGLRVNPT